MESGGRDVRSVGVYSPTIMRIWSYMALTKRGLTIPEVMLIAGTRVALGVGLGLLISDWLNKDQRHVAGWALLGVGALTTIPIVRGLLAKPPIGGGPTALVS
jgi:hypothetical protein